MKRLRSRAKSQSDVSQHSDEGCSSRPLTPQVLTEPSSPYKKILGFKSGKRIQSVWSTLKRFAPHKLRSRSKDYHSRRKNNLKSVGRLSSSHPDVSSSNLAAVAKGYRDDTAVGTDDALDFADAPSFSDPTINQDSTSDHRSRELNSLSTRKLGDGIFGDGLLRRKTTELALARQKEASLRKYAFFQLDVHLRHGRNLVARDSCGTSDPYVKFKIGGKQLYKSRIVPKSLDPFWDEYFSLPIEDVFQPLNIRVFDYDFALQDDYMGSAELDLTQLELKKSIEMAITLTESGKPEDDPSKSWGQIFLTFTLIPKTQEEKEQYFKRSSFKIAPTGESSNVTLKKQKTQVWDNVVTLVLVQGKDLLAMDEGGTSDPYVKFKLGSEKYKSKNAVKTLNPQWLEQFDLHMFTDQPKVLEISVFDKDFHGRDDFMGRCSLDLSQLDPEKTHSIWLELEDGAGFLFLLVTISGAMSAETITDLACYDPDPKETESLIKKYGLVHSFINPNDVGHLTVKVYKAQGLAAADLCGKSDPFCVLELVNSRLQTHTEYKTLSPEWNKIFTFQIKDIHSVLEITVFDEDRDKKVEFLGKVAIPILKIKSGEKRWFALKDKKLRKRSKGQILLELNTIFNPIRASVVTFNPKEAKYMQKEQRFKTAIFMRNTTRVRLMILEILEIAKFLNSCFQWESKARSIISFVIFLVITYSFELYMLPVALLLIFFKNYMILILTGFSQPRDAEEEFEEEDDDDDEDERDTKGEEKKTLKERLQAVQDVTASIQNVLGDIASLGERVKNTFNFSVPFLSWLAILVLCIAALILYLIPMRFLIMAWGVNKFTKKLRNPDAISNNELLDFLSRVPDNDEKIMCRDLRPILMPVADVDKKKKKKTN